jgi:hypothetical protein
MWIGIDSDANPGEDISYAYGAIQGNGDNGRLTVGAENRCGTSGGVTYFNGSGTLPSNGTQLRVTTNGATPPPAVFTAVKDSTLIGNARNANDGAADRLHLAKAGKRRPVVAFDLSGVDAQCFASVTGASLRLTIAENDHGWGGGRPVRAHPLLEDFTEGNGVHAEEPEGDPGSGPGVTWNCATDTNIANDGRNCATSWQGGNFGPATGGPVVHTNSSSGPVEWDVTGDVQAGATGWLIKKRQEAQNGGVHYFSKEGSVLTFADLSAAPTLTLEFGP